MVNSIFLDALDKLIKESNTSIFDWKIKNNINLNDNSFIFFIKSFINQKWWIKNILMNYKETINGNNFSSNDWEKYILWMVDKEKLIERDPKRYILGTVPYANYIFKNIMNDDFKLFLESFSDENPLKQKYQNKDIISYEDKFECLRDYINENSFALDAAAIGWMSGATDFLQLYKYIMMEEIINKKDRKEIINKLFGIFKSKKIEDFIQNYDNFIDLLKIKNNNDDKRLSRLYNRLYFIFSFILNNLKPEEFPIYFSATRNTLKVFWIEWYENLVTIYKNVLENSYFTEFIKIYLQWVSISLDNYSLKNIFSYDEIFFENHAKYRFFQDLCWVLNRNVLDGQDFVNNLWKWKKFNFDELKNKIYTFEKKDFYVLDEIKKLEENWNDEKNKRITFWEIINIKYLIDEWYIREVSSWEYEVIKIDDFYIWKTGTQQ